MLFYLVMIANVHQGDLATGSSYVVSVPTGEGVLGRILDPLGRPD